MKIPGYFRFKRLMAVIVFALWPFLSNAADAEQYLRDAQSYFDKGEYSAAVIQLKNALLADPDNGQARLLLGQAYLRLEDGPSAHKELSRALELGVSREVVLEPLGRAMLLTGKSDEILEILSVEEDDPVPLKVDIHVLLGKAHMASEQDQLADEQFSLALELDPASVEALLGKARIAYKSGDNERVVELLDRAQSLEPDNADVWTLKGEKLRAEAQLPDALSAFQKALNIEPTNMYARVGKVWTLIMLGEPDTALEEIDRIQERYPRLYLSNYLKALALFHKQQLEQALEAVQLSVEQAPGHLPGHLLAGTISFQQGLLNQAERHLRKYINEVPDDIQAIKLLSATLMKKQEPANAVEVMEAGVQAAVDDAQYLAMLGSAYLALGEASKGMEYMDRAIALAPDVAALRTQLAIGQLVEGDVDQAVSELQTAVELDQGLQQAELMLVLIYLQKQEYDNALSAAEALAVKMPDSPVPLNLKGAALLGNEERQEARKAFEAALGIQPDFLSAHLNLARLDLMEGDTTGAEARYRKVLSIDAGNLKALLALAALAERDGRVEETEMRLKLAREHHPDEIKPALMLVEHYLRQDDARQALDLISGIAAAQPQNPVVLNALVTAQLQSGEYKYALATLRSLVEVDPESPGVHYQLAMVSVKLEDSDVARKSLHRAIELQPDYPDAQLVLARLDIIDTEFDSAFAIADELKQKHPDKAYGYELDGDILAAMKKPREAADAYTLAYEKVPSDQLVHKLLHYHLMAGNEESALGVLRHWLSEHPEDITVRSLLAITLHSSGRQEQAVDEYLKLLEYDPDNITTLNNLAWLYQEQGNPDAVQYADRAYELAPERPEVIDTLGWLLVQNGEITRGLVLLQEAVTKAPHVPGIRYHMAVALMKAGRREEARKELDRLLRTGKKFPERDEAAALRIRLE